MSVGVRWHVEADGKILPFTRGTSMYTVTDGLIQKGFDVPEPTIKAGNLSLKILETASSIIAEPSRGLVWIAWLAYCYFLFLSDLTPGLNALQLDPGTWKEVADLSLNFWLVLPILTPESAPLLHPGLEGIFNLVIVWAALFWGFAADGRSPRGSFLPTLGIMQFLTNAAFLPYLATRQSEKHGVVVAIDELSAAEKIGESRGVPLLFGIVGTLCIAWALYGRPEFGDIPTRFNSLVSDHISKDRLSFSFCVDICYYAVFQGWLVGDDLKRRGADEYLGSSVARFVPFYGLIYYLLTRPPLRSSQN